MTLYGASKYGASQTAGAAVGQGQLHSTELLSLQLAAQGYSAAQIARLREVSVSELANTLSGAFLALGVSTLTNAITEARRRGLIR